VLYKNRGTPKKRRLVGERDGEKKQRRELEKKRERGTG